MPRSSSDSPRTLILMRHGKSAYPPGIDDHDRPLAPRGQREAALGGDWIRAHFPAVDQVICSTAARTRETLAATGISAPTEFSRALYCAYPEEVFGALALLDDAVRTALVIGHFPSIPETALLLAANSDSELATDLAQRYPTSAICALSIPAPWADARPGIATLTHFHVPRHEKAPG
jgi:phosphohistidine phosphatase